MKNMPKIHRIRIVGLKYDGMQKQYQDTTFDFHNDVTSTNGLIAMMNGGGKGVFLQTIFQVLKPGTSWGKQNNRYYQQFFFNKNEQFIPYTFHVLIQWELDGSDRRHLVTGGMFSAEQRISLNEENADDKPAERHDKIVPNITFYAREFDRKEDVALEHIPLYENGQVAETEELKDYFKWNGYDVYRDTKKHYRILDTYGINRKDWDIMKDINKDEGGVGKYFEGAEDDHSLFQKRIIPTVSGVLDRAEHQKNDLIDIFKSQASIAKDLPVLLKREQAHKEFLEDIIPFEEQIAVGVEHQKVVSDSTQQGQQLLGALDHVIELEKDALVALEKKLEELNEQSLQLRFEKDNLEYARAHQELQKWEKQLAEEKAKHEELKALVLERNEKKDTLSFAVQLKEWSDIEQTIASLSQQIEKLEKNSGLEEVNLRMEEIKKEANHIWDEAFSAIKDENNHFQSFKRYIDKRGKELTLSDKKKTGEIAQISAEIDALYTKIHEFEMKQDQLIQLFGDRLKYDLPGFIESLVQKQESKKQELETLLQKEKQSQDKQNTISLTVGELRQSLQHQEVRCNELREAASKQQSIEQELLERLQLLLTDVTGPFSHALLSKYGAGIEELLQQNNEQSEQLKKELWEIQVDQYLNDENYWIANQDVKELKEWIDEKTGIDVFYGTQFLQSLNAEEKIEHIERYPLLPYGLVVYQNQWQKINQQVLKGRMFKSPVPIYMREEMQGEDQPSYVVIHGTEQNFLTDHLAFANWQTDMSKQIEEKRDTLNELSKTESALRRILKDIDRLSAGTLSVEIERTIQAEETAIRTTKEELQRILKDEEKEKEKQTLLNEQIEATKKIIEKCVKDLDTLQLFEKEKEQNDENKRVKEEKDKKHKLLQTQQTEIEKENEELQQLTSQWNQTYLEWKLSLEQEMKEISKFVDNVHFPVSETVSYDGETPSLSVHVLDDIKGSINELKQLQKSKEEQAQELLAIQANREAELKQQKKLEKRLQSQNPDWKTTEIASEPMSILEEMLNASKKEAKESEKAEREQEKAVTVAETTLKHTQEQCDKMEKKVAKHGRQPEKWEEDLDVKESEIKDRTKLTKDELKATEKQFSETETSIEAHKGDRITLSMILKEEAATFEPEDIELIQKQGKACILAWCEKHQNLQEEEKEKRIRADQALRKLKMLIESKDWELRFKNDVLMTLDHLDTRHYEHIQGILQNMKRFSASGLEQLERDKERAEKAQQFWASRASMKVMSISDAIRSMIAKMKIKNERGAFPLVTLKEDILPKKAEDIEPLLKQHFVSAIEKITAKFESIDDNNKELDTEIKQLIGDEQILFVSLRNRYPELLVYNMRTDNAFMYGRPQKEHYSTWQTINQGSKTKSDGSGGQKLSARMVMMMMLLSVKSETDQSWVPLVCDNPFGQAASAHVLDPIFAVAEKLKFQLIVVTPPELVKTEISQRFDSYYKLDFLREKGKEIVTETVVPAFRIYQEEPIA